MGLSYWAGLALGSMLGFPLAFQDKAAFAVGLLSSLSVGLISSVIFYSTYRITVAGSSAASGTARHAMGCGFGTGLVLALQTYIRIVSDSLISRVMFFVIIATYLVLPALLGRTTGHFARKSPSP